MDSKIYQLGNEYIDGGQKLPKSIKGSDRCRAIDFAFECFIKGVECQEEEQTKLYSETEIKDMYAKYKETIKRGKTFRKSCEMESISFIEWFEIHKKM